MKKTMLVTSLLLVLSMVLSGCFLAGGIKLEEDQIEYIFDEDGGLTLRAFMSDKELEDAFDVDFDDKKKEIEEDIIDYFDDEVDTDVEVKKLDISKDTASFELYIEDGEDFFMEMEVSLEDYADDYYGVDVDELEDYEEFVYYKDGDDVKNKDVEDFSDDYVINVHGGDEGAYYTFPSKVLLVGDKVDYEKIDNDTIFIDDGEYGLVVIEEY